MFPTLFITCRYWFCKGSK